MKVLCSFPGKFGDILWALPTVRALSRRLGQPVDLAVSAKYGSLAPLLREQPYLKRVHVLENWVVQETAPMTPRVPPGVAEFGLNAAYEVVFHLGYRGWPQRPLPFETLHTFNCANQYPLRLEVGERPILDAELAAARRYARGAASACCG